MPRGVFHEAGFFLVVALSVPLVLSAETDQGARLGDRLLGLSRGVLRRQRALPPADLVTPVRSWLARVDHAGIYLLIAGTYTPFGLLVLSRNWAIPVLAVVYTGAALAILTKLFWYRAPKPLSAVIALLLGWVAVAASPSSSRSARWASRSSSSAACSTRSVR